MPNGLKRRYGLGHLYFVTFGCYRRLPLLGSVRAGDDFDGTTGPDAGASRTSRACVLALQ
jgi:hypothetical protein